MRSDPGSDSDSNGEDIADEDLDSYPTEGAVHESMQQGGDDHDEDNNTLIFREYGW